MIGTGDLRLSLGLSSKRSGGSDEAIFTDAVYHLIKSAKKHKKPLMVVAFKVSIEKDSWIRDFNMLLTSADILSIVQGHRHDLSRLKEIMTSHRISQVEGLEK
ncbi:hypothetical protein K3495_g7191 [Podosphaera aphanis]|nr:hypothetical protein K3495_g7191 [Podosphaera aphanis]